MTTQWLVVDFLAFLHGSGLAVAGVAALLVGGVALDHPYHRREGQHGQSVRQ